MADFSQEKQVEIVHDALILTAIILEEEKELRNLTRTMCPFKEPQKLIALKPQYPQKKTIPKPEYKPANEFTPPTPPKSNKWGPFQDPVWKWIMMASFAPMVLGMWLETAALVWIGTILVVGVLVYSSRIKDQKQKELDEKFLHSERYKKYESELEKARNEYNERVAEAKASYEKQLETYNKRREEEETAHKVRVEEYQTKLLPAYEIEVKKLEEENNHKLQEYHFNKIKWEEEKNNKIMALKNDLEFNKGTLEELYNTTRIISKTYREPAFLEWLYEDMSSSDHTILVAMEIMDRQRQIIATRRSAEDICKRIDGLDSTMRTGFDGLYAGIKQGNLIKEEIGNRIGLLGAIMEEGNRELKDMRRDQNVANIVSIYQRYKYNKKAK